MLPIIQGGDNTCHTACTVIIGQHLIQLVIYNNISSLCGGQLSDTGIAIVGLRVFHGCHIVLIVSVLNVINNGRPAQCFNGFSKGLAVEYSLVCPVAHDLRTAVIDLLGIGSPACIIVVQPLPVENRRLDLVQEDDLRCHGLGKGRVIVKSMMRDLKHIGLEVRGRIHLHQNGICLENIT